MDPRSTDAVWGVLAEYRARDATKAELAYERAEAEYKRGLRAAAGIIALLVALCVLASLWAC